MQRNIRKITYYNEHSEQDKRCPLCGANLIYTAHAKDCPIRTIDCVVREDEESDYEY